jgi:hypothetical protein
MGVNLMDGGGHSILPTEKIFRPFLPGGRTFLQRAGGLLDIWKIIVKTIEICDYYCYVIIFYYILLTLQ